MRRISELIYISVAEAKARLSEKIKSASLRGRRFAITSHGKPKAVLIDYKEYISLIENAVPEEPEKISLSDWKKKRVARKEVVESISKLFDEKKLSRKGQKGYKRDEVRKIQKAKKQT